MHIPQGTPILHQYAGSPYSEKLRLMFGFKGLAWQAVETPPIMPKPDLMPLTGGYRRAPVLQIGADVYCDTQLMARVLERLAPTPSLHPYGEGATHASLFWTDGPIFQAAVGLVFANMPEVDSAFVADREAMTGQTGFVEVLKANAPFQQEQLRAHLQLLESQLSDGRHFLMGDAASLADFNLYNPIWFLVMGAGGDAVLALGGNKALQGWFERMGAFGHGDREDISGEQALDIAAAAAPNLDGTIEDGEPNGLEKGQLVSITSTDLNRDPVTGAIVSASAQHISIHRQDDRVGDIVQHFPRLGYRVSVE